MCYQGKEAPKFLVDQHNCVYLQSTTKQLVSFNFCFEQTDNTSLPIPEDSEDIVFEKLTDATELLLQQISSEPALKQAARIKSHIISHKKYNTTKQGTLRLQSNRNTYIANLDASTILECYSANSLFVALCRKKGIPARLVV
ncbi:MAG: transglutaminase domain-containing protein [Candidatus Peribacteria bacterium]|nr:MAG: transglutaminase domain-containing protein [Candidatus Peribacteria bacterium]